MFEYFLDGFYKRQKKLLDVVGPRRTESTEEYYVKLTELERKSNFFLSSYSKKYFSERFESNNFQKFSQLVVLDCNTVHMK